MAPFADSFAKSAADPSLPAAVRAGYASTVDDLGLYREDVEGLFLPTKIEGFATERLLPDPVRPVELRFLGRGNTDGISLPGCRSTHSRHRRSCRRANSVRLRLLSEELGGRPSTG